ncbi:trichohyalin-like protein 1 [Acomys russatus]|uniref:trichohyalin-like protein 1 n=1 Tax=Acomys russatus TaxID=60746 RepID=UPI0021E29C14|nr:trichohyalin-like protein 1 [Acomys russatus]
MSRFLSGIFCVIETFHKYASEDGDKATLTHRELRQLLEGEIGNFLQPHFFHAVERKLNLLDIDRDGTISFEEFLLAIFSLLNLFYLDISLLNSEPRVMSKSEKMGAEDFQAIPRGSHQVAGAGPAQERLEFPSKMASSVQPRNEEGEADGHTKMSLREDVKIHNLPREASEPSDPENQQPEENCQEAAQEVPATEGDDEVPFKRNTLVEGSKQSSSLTQEIPRERGKPARRQSDTKISDHVAQRPSEDEERAAATQAPFPQKDKAASEPLEAAAGKPSETQEVFEPVDGTGLSEAGEVGKGADRVPPEGTSIAEREADSRTPETQALPTQETTQETRDQSQSVQSESRNASETSSGGEREEEWDEPERKTRPPAPETQTQDERCKELPGSWSENGAGAEKGSGAQDPSSEDDVNQNLPTITEESISGKEARPHEEDTTALVLAINRKSPAAEETLGTKERSQELAPPEKQSQDKNHRASRTPDKAVRVEDHPLPVAQSGEDTCETPNSLAPEVGKSSAGTGEPQVTGESQSQVDPHGSHNNHPDPQNPIAPGESRRVPEEVVLSIQEDRHAPEEQEQSAAEEQEEGLSSGTKRGPAVAAVEPCEGGEGVRKTTAGSKNRTSGKAESSAAQ